MKMCQNVYEIEKWLDLAHEGKNGSENLNMAHWLEKQ